MISSEHVQDVVLNNDVFAVRRMFDEVGLTKDSNTRSYTEEGKLLAFKVLTTTSMVLAQRHNNLTEDMLNEIVERTAAVIDIRSLVQLVVPICDIGIKAGEFDSKVIPWQIRRGLRKYTSKVADMIRRLGDKPFRALLRFIVSDGFDGTVRTVHTEFNVQICRRLRVVINDESLLVRMSVCLRKPDRPKNFMVVAIDNGRADGDPGILRVLGIEGFYLPF